MALIEQHSCAKGFSATPASMSILQRLALWRSRRALATLDARALDDIGVTTEEAQTEAKRALWDAPANWTGR